MPAEFVPDYEGIGEVMRSEAVAAELHRVAETVLSRARSLASQQGETAFANALRVDDGVRPKGRPYSRVVADDAAAEGVEFGSNTHPIRRRILGQAAEVKIF